MENDQKLSIKIKTMDEALFEFEVKSSDNISSLKNQILEELGIPLDRQRIVFMGKLMQDQDSFEKHGVTSGNVLHLIASLEDRGETQEDSPVQNDVANQTNNPASGNREAFENENMENEDGETVLHDRAQEEILAGIFRTLSDTSLNRRNYRWRLLQQRMAGFSVNSKESKEVIRQNLMTLDQLEAAKVNDFEKVKPISSIKGFDFSDRKLKIGQWIDVKDTIDQWLEAEVINVRESQVFVHYNGWGRRWDEWIDMNSPRIAAFRTHTVQNPYSMFMSPNPCHPLDGDHTHVRPVEVGIEQVIKDTKGQTEDLGIMLAKILEVGKKREELLQKSKKGKSEKSPISVKIRKRKRIRYKKGKRFAVLGSHEKYDKAETQSNFSLRVNEKRELGNIRDDCRSMKSLKRTGDQEEEQQTKVEKTKDNDSISSKSFNSRSQMSANLNFDFPDYISEERSSICDDDEEEEYKRNEIMEEKINLEMELNKVTQELVSRCSHLSPIMDRLGRLFIDLAPHIAMMSSGMVPPTTNTVSNVSMLTHNASELSGNIQRNDPIHRLLNPSVHQTNLAGDRSSIGRRTQMGFAGTGISSHRNMLSSHGRTLNFEIPVMLTPGELLSVIQRHNNLLGEGNVHLHLNAQVHLPQNEGDYLRTPSQARTRDTMFGARDSSNNQNGRDGTNPVDGIFNTDTTEQINPPESTPFNFNTTETASQNNTALRPRMQSVSTQTRLLNLPTESIANNQNSHHTPPHQHEMNSPLINPRTQMTTGSFTQNFRLYRQRRSPFNQNSQMGLHRPPNFGTTTSEGPGDTELSEIPTVMNYDKRGGMSTMRDDDRKRELLDNSLHDTIEERDENEEPEMQDISFRDLDFGVDIIEKDGRRNCEEVICDDDDLGDVFLGRLDEGKTNKAHFGSDIKAEEDDFILKQEFNTGEMDVRRSCGAAENDKNQENVISNFSLKQLGHTMSMNMEEQIAQNQRVADKAKSVMDVDSLK